jgi:membrane-bound inhibitor of C-type lysozyme
MTFKRVVFYIVIIVLLGIIAYSFVHSGPKLAAPTITPPVAPVVTSTSVYACDAGKTITAGFSDSNVHVALSDGRSFDLPHAVSADGAQYKNDTVSFITKGDQAFLQENNTTTYDNCIVDNSGAAVNGQKTFTDQGKTFTFSYPQEFSVSGGGIGYTESWKVDSDSTLGLILANISVPASYQPKTNFGDAKLTVGTSSDPAAVKNCLVDTSGAGVTKSTATINGVKYAKLITQDAGAGNRYLTTSYRTVQNSQCYAVEYTIHYAVLENFDPSSGIKGFDQKKVTDTLDAIVQSFKFLPQ